MQEGSNTTSCEIPTTDWSALEGSFEEVVERLESDVMWIRFFAVRPCCPPPGEEAARNHVAELKERIEQQGDWTEDQRAALTDIADQRLSWYIKRFVKNRPPMR